MKWEYYSIRVAGNIDVEPLDEAGSQGWELVAISGEIAYFTRPMPETIEKTGSFEDVAKEIQAIGGGWNAIENPEAFSREMRGDDRNPVEIVHGVNCPKVEHERYDTFIHDADFDGTYQVDGIRYCGRCHRQIESYGEVKSVPSETDRLKSEIATVKKELESACRRHAAELERAAQYKGISIQYREIVGTLCEAIKPTVDHFESGKSSATIPDGYLQELVRAYRETKAGICAEVENGK